MSVLYFNCKCATFRSMFAENGTDFEKASDKTNISYRFETARAFPFLENAARCKQSFDLFANDRESFWSNRAAFSKKGNCRNVPISRKCRTIQTIILIVCKWTRKVLVRSTFVYRTLLSSVLVMEGWQSLTQWKISRSLLRQVCANVLYAVIFLELTVFLASRSWEIPFCLGYFPFTLWRHDFVWCASM